MTTLSAASDSRMAHPCPSDKPPVGDESIVAFYLENVVEGVAFPVTCGIPLPINTISSAQELLLKDALGQQVVAQFEPLAHWPNGSVKAVRAHWVGNQRAYELYRQRGSVTDAPPDNGYETPADESPLTIDDGYRVQLTHPIFGGLSLELKLGTEQGKEFHPQWAEVQTCANGPVCTMLELHGRYPAIADLRVRLRLSLYKNSPQIHASVRLQNARRARHQGGLWDLGDSNSISFKSFELITRRPGSHRIQTRFESATRWKGPFDQFQIYQDSSGGDNWKSINHIDREGRVPCQFRGYQATSKNEQVGEGLRATPTVILEGEHPLAVTMPEFWQQFPKKISAHGGEVTVALFPSDWSTSHELQPGEQKTHAVWLALSSDPQSLEPAHNPCVPIFSADWYAKCDLFDAWPSLTTNHLPIYQDLLDTAVDDRKGLAARREVIDEYGWRNWGELWADHEQPSSGDASPIVSHYNNQYDVIEGALRHFARTGDPRWRRISDPLTRHVLDIDLYHTDQDRPVYNRGYFWHTDHYRPARTATHRTYSRDNQDGRSNYGGGPSSSHCYSTGLLHLYYLSGDPDFRQTVIDLAEWLIAMEDGSRTEFCLLDAGPTGISTISAESWYHGPGRAPANAINTLLDAWELTNDRRYRDHAEHLLERVVTPGEDISRLELLDIERRWFYTMFLQSLAKYLAAKIRANENDAAFARGVAVARDYAAWMLENEQPYFDRVDELEYPTETWAAQEIRKANAMRALARFCPAELSAKVLVRAHEIAERGWDDLGRFESRTLLRPTAILMIEGLRDAFYRREQDCSPPEPTHPVERQLDRVPFLTQRERAKLVLRSPTQLVKALGTGLKPTRLVRFFNAIRTRF